MGKTGGQLADELARIGAGVLGGKTFTDEQLDEAAQAGMQAMIEVLWRHAYCRSDDPDAVHRSQLDCSD